VVRAVLHTARGRVRFPHSLQKEDHMSCTMCLVHIQELKDLEAENLELMKKLKAAQADARFCRTEWIARIEQVIKLQNKLKK
jgi:hypothetical protein